MGEAIASLKALLARMNITRASILEFATSSLETDQGQVGYAFLKHAQDIIYETPEVTDRDLMCECYRRTFFDKEYVRAYGTQHVAMRNAKQANEMVEHLALQHDCAERGAHVHQEASAAQ
jgi:hypothetical protein